MKKTTALLSLSCLLIWGYLIISSLTNQETKDIEFNMDELAWADSDWEAVVTSTYGRTIQEYQDDCVKKDIDHPWWDQIKICEWVLPDDTEIVKVAWDNSWFAIWLWKVSASNVFQLKTLDDVAKWNLWLIRLLWSDKVLEIKRSKWAWSTITWKVMIKEFVGNFINNKYTKDIDLNHDSTIIIDKNNGIITISTEWQVVDTGVESFVFEDASVIFFNKWSGIIHTDNLN